MPLTVTFKDPETIALVMRYAQFMEQRDGVGGTIEQVAEGLIIGYLDEHPSFVQWHRAATAAMLPIEDNVIDFAQAQRVESVRQIYQKGAVASK